MQTGTVSGILCGQHWWGFQSQSAQDGYMLCDLQVLLINVLWPLPCLVCMSIETAFLLEVTTVTLQRWSMGPQSWACTRANQSLMCLLRDPAVHETLFHHSRQMDGLSAWKASDTWRHRWGQGYWVRDDGDGLIRKGVLSLLSSEWWCMCVQLFH